MYALRGFVRTSLSFTNDWKRLNFVRHKSLWGRECKAPSTDKKVFLSERVNQASFYQQNDERLLYPARSGYIFTVKMRNSTILFARQLTPRKCRLCSPLEGVWKNYRNAEGFLINAAYWSTWLLFCFTCCMFYVWKSSKWIGIHLYFKELQKNQGYNDWQHTERGQL